MTFSNTQPLETPIAAAFEQANSILYGCPIDGLTLYTDSPLTLRARQVAEDRYHDDHWHYNLFLRLPQGAATIISDPKVPCIPWETIIRINPHKGLLRYPQFEDLLTRDLREYIMDFDTTPLWMVRVECKLDLYGWHVDEVDRCIWAKRLHRQPPRYPGTYYYGADRRRSQVRVYDKAAEIRERTGRELNAPDGLTRIERVYSWAPDKREEFTPGAFLQLIMDRKPFDDVVLIDFSDVPNLDGRRRLPRMYNQGLTFMQMLERTHNASDKAALRRYANEHPYYDLYREFRESFALWHGCTMRLPDEAGPELETEAFLQHYVNQVLEEETA